RRKHRSARWRRTCRAPLRRWTCHRHRVRGPWARRRQWCGLREPIRLDRDGRKSQNRALAGLHGLAVSHARTLHEDLIVAARESHALGVVYSRSTRCTNATAIAPSPTAEATRL